MVGISYLASIYVLKFERESPKSKCLNFGLLHFFSGFDFSSAGDSSLKRCQRNDEIVFRWKLLRSGFRVGSIFCHGRIERKYFSRRSKHCVALRRSRKKCGSFSGYESVFDIIRWPQVKTVFVILILTKYLMPDLCCVDNPSVAPAKKWIPWSTAPKMGICNRLLFNASCCLS